MSILLSLFIRRSNIAALIKTEIKVGTVAIRHIQDQTYMRPLDHIRTFYVSQQKQNKNK